ncbi:hypothetical protein [Halomonas sp.]|uniref:hypothetical protein n=1 Tax=Halomonas sp. TaxID=1486246 RepID=UPI00261E9B60|nr:hypothetical protein [Halomonas sp.]
MATIVDDHVMVCDDCLMIIANDDATGLDHFLDEESAAAREREVRDSIYAAQRSATGTPSSSAIASTTKRSRPHPATAATPTWQALGTTAC